MKNIWKISLIALLTLFVGACDNTELEGLLDNPNEVTPENAELNLLFNNTVLQFAGFCDEASDETMSYVRMVAMTGGFTYNNQDQPQSFDFIWNRAYADLLPDLNLIIEKGEEDGAKRHVAIAKIMKAYVLFTMVDMFGDIPYSEALQGIAQPNPKADSGSDVYAAGLGLLNEAIEDLKVTAPVPSGDIYYGGSSASNATKWTKLANTLKLRYYVMTRLVNSSAKSEIEALVSGGNIITATADDWQFPYGTNRVNPDSRHPFYSDGYEVGGPSWYMSNYYMWIFLGVYGRVEDPRLRYYFYRQDCDETGEDPFTIDCPLSPYPFHWPDGLPFCTASLDFGDPDGLYSGYWGRDHGNAEGIPPDDLKRSAMGLYPAGGKFDANDCSQVSNSGTDGAKGAGIQPMMLASWADFLRAEAALALSTADNARALLESGMRKSIAKVMGFESRAPVSATYKPSAAAVDAYVNDVLAKYDAAATTSDKLNIVMFEYYKALWGNGLDAYNNYRRTGMPKGMQPVREANPGPFPRSMWYPSDFVNLNSTVNQKTLTQKVFWDTNPDDFIN